MIEKLKVVIKPEDWKLPVDELEMRCLKNLLLKVDELVDAVNAIQKEREAERFEIQEWIGILEDVRKSVNKHGKLIDTLVEENNIHERQIDKLQMMLEPHKCEPAENTIMAKNANVAENGNFAKIAQDETPRCPFCQQEMICGGTICHFNPDCPIHDNPVPTEVLELLDRTRKALDVAVDALKSVRKCLCEMPDPSGATILSMACESATIVKNALEQITALEQKDVK